MSLICSCSSEVCAVMGCQRAAQIRQQFQRQQPAMPNKTYPLRPLTEEDVRRIVHEELARGGQP